MDSFQRCAALQIIGYIDYIDYVIAFSRKHFVLPVPVQVHVRGSVNVSFFDAAAGWTAVAGVTINKRTASQVGAAVFAMKEISPCRLQLL
jgi:hypothetical protein